MYRALDLTWEGAFPYDVLDEAGVTPNSSMHEVEDANFYFAAQHRVEEALDAMSALERVEGRLFVDFFLYRTPVQEQA